MEFKLILTGPSSCIPPLSRAVIFLTVPQRLTFGVIPPLDQEVVCPGPTCERRSPHGLNSCTWRTRKGTGQVHACHFVCGPRPQASDRGVIPSGAAALCLLYLSNDWDGRKGGEGAHSHTICLLFGAPLQDFPQEILGAAGAEWRPECPRLRVSKFPSGPFGLDLMVIYMYTYM